VLFGQLWKKECPGVYQFIKAKKQIPITNDALYQSSMKTEINLLQ
jgi:hypothetical protein